MLDLISVYWQVELEEADREKAEFYTREITGNQRTVSSARKSQGVGSSRLGTVEPYKAKYLVTPNATLICLDAKCPLLSKLLDMG